MKEVRIRMRGGQEKMKIQRRMGKEKVIHIALSTTSHKRTCTNSDLKHTDRKKTFFPQGQLIFPFSHFPLQSPKLTEKLRVLHIFLLTKACATFSADTLHKEIIKCSLIKVKRHERAKAKRNMVRWAGTFSFTRTCKSLGTTGENTCYLLEVKHYSHLFKGKWTFRMFVFCLLHFRHTDSSKPIKTMTTSFLLR